MEGALDVAEHIRENVENAVIPCRDCSTTTVTVSIGANTQTPMQNDSAAFFISCADKALYIAKKTGKNRTASYVHEAD